MGPGQAQAIANAAKHRVQENPDEPYYASRAAVLQRQADRIRREANDPDRRR
jgi:hypothetical protein